MCGTWDSHVRHAVCVKRDSPVKVALQCVSSGTVSCEVPVSPMVLVHPTPTLSVCALGALYEVAQCDLRRDNAEKTFTACPG